MKISMPSVDEMLKKHGMEKNGKSQSFMQKEVIRHMTPYTPRLSGDMIRSAVRGSSNGEMGTIVYNSPYARRQYYKNKGRGLEGLATGTGKRGKKWLDRMKLDKLPEILRAVAEKVGARWEK